MAFNDPVVFNYAGGDYSIHYFVGVVGGNSVAIRGDEIASGDTVYSVLSIWRVDEWVEFSRIRSSRIGYSEQDHRDAANIHIQKVSYLIPTIAMSARNRK